MPVNYSIINGFKYLSGTTAQRPANPVAGSTYFNTTVGALQIYQNGGWYSFQSVVAPGVPISVVATDVGTGRAYNNGSASVAFSPVTETGGVASSFTVTSTPGSYTASGTSSPIVVTGLQSSTGYTYAVTATNSAGTSSASSASSSVTATTVPQAPTIGTATAGNAQASVTFTAGATGGAAISSYTVTSSPGSITATGSSSPITITGLTNGTSYTFTVTATNANGTSAASSATSAVSPTSWAPDSGYDSLATVVVPSGGLSSITFAGIPSGYKHLQLRVLARGTVAATDQEQYITFNGTSTNYYSAHILYGTGSSALSTVSSYTTVNLVPRLIAASSTASAFTSYVTDILDYSNTNKNKTIRSVGGFDANGSGEIDSMSGLWMNTAAINSINIRPSTANYAEFSSFALYGVK